MSRLVDFMHRLWNEQAAVMSWLAPLAIFSAFGAAGLRIALWRPPEFPATLASLSPAAGNAPASAESTTSIPPSALAATLWDELFPPPPPPVAEAPLPKLDVELIAIIVAPPGVSDPSPLRRAVVFRNDLSELIELRVGDAIPGRPEITLIALTDRAATFDVGGRTVTLELQP